MSNAAPATPKAPTFDPTSIPVPGPFAVSFSIPIPEGADKPTRATSLPFSAYFDTYEEAAFAGAQPHFFIPCTYYKDRPGVKWDNVDPAYVRTKVRDAFRKWQATEGKNRDKLYVTVINRAAKDEGTLAMAKAMGIQPEAGVSVWVRLTTA